MAFFSEDKSITYRSVPEGFGGTFTFTSETSSIIGTSGLITCVGVYLPIDEHRCFFAHIYGRRPSTYFTGDSFTKDLTLDEIESIRYKVRTKLREHSQEHDWTPADVKEAVRHGKKIVVMCPCLYDEPRRPGTAVLNGIRDFLGIMDEDEGWTKFIGMTEWQGFVVNVSSNVVTEMPVHLVEERLIPPANFTPQTDRAAERQWRIVAD